MLAKVIDGLRDENAKPIFTTDKDFDCDFPICYAVIIEDNIATNIRVHLYLNIDEALEKFNDYDKRLNTTLDPIEYDTIKNLARDLALVIPIKFDEDKSYYHRFKISAILKTNKAYNKIFNMEY